MHHVIIRLLEERANRSQASYAALLMAVENQSSLHAFFLVNEIFVLNFRDLIIPVAG